MISAFIKEIFGGFREQTVNKTHDKRYLRSKIALFAASDPDIRKNRFSANANPDKTCGYCERYSELHEKYRRPIHDTY